MTTEEHSDHRPREIKPRESAVGLHPPDIPVQTPRLLRAWQVTAFALAITAAVWVAICFIYSPRVAAPDVQEVLGYVAQIAHFESLPANRIVRFEPHSPLLSAGVEVGDLIVNPPRGTLLPGESVQLQIHGRGGVRTIEIRSNQIGQLSGLAANVLALCLGALALVLGGMIAFRRRRDVAALSMGCALLLGAISIPDNIFPVGLLGRLSDLVQGTFSAFALAALAYSVLTFEAGYRSRARPHLVRALIGYCTISGTVILLWVAPYCLGWIWLSPDTVIRPISAMVGVAALLLCFLAFADAWRHIQGEPRQRLRWVIAAMAIVLAGTGFGVLFQLGIFGYTTSAATLLNFFEVILVAVGMITLTYAVLRHRVIDVGFVISRTLVFAVFTGLLLVLFAAVEWLVGHLVHYGQRESSVLIDGTIAVALYLIFHRVRNGIERFVEGVFFRESRAKQMELRHFLETAPNFSSSDALARALLQAVDAYTGSRGSGIYRRDKSGRFLLDESTLDQLPRVLAADSEVIIELKTSRKPYQFGRLGFDLAALALPVVRRAELVGFLAVSAKTDRTLYRPDEIENLIRSVHQVSSDLYALQLEHFQQRSQELEQQVDALRDQLRSFGPASTSLANTS